MGKRSRRKAVKRAAKEAAQRAAMREALALEKLRKERTPRNLIANVVKKVKVRVWGFVLGLTKEVGFMVNACNNWYTSRWESFVK